MTKAFLKYRPRILLISFFVVILWAGLLIRFFYVQVVKSNELRNEMVLQGYNKITVPALRGTIYDRNLQSLAEDAIHYDFAAHPHLVENKQHLSSTFSEITGRTTDYYTQLLNSNQTFKYLERNLRSNISNSLLAIKDKGLVIHRHGYRSYPYQNIASQLIGFTDMDNIGLSGIEKVYDDYLKGKDGWMMLQKDGRGKLSINESYPSQDPVDGSNVVLTINLEYQTILRNELLIQMEEVNATGAMGIIINPNDGEILAMVSIPDFDPNNRAVYSKQTYRNRVVEDQFEPGSTFKIVPATAALRLKTVAVTDEFYCEDGGFTFRGLTIRDWSDFGLLTFSQIIEHSSNVGIIKIAKTLDKHILYTFARKYGFGSPTGISLPGETSGTLHPTDEWCAVSLAQISLGHEVSVTTLQLAYAYAAIANGGFLMKPILVDEIIHPSGRVIFKNSPRVVRKITSKNEMKRLTAMLEGAVTSGTGTNANIRGWKVAGKTGTAQMYINGAYSDTKFISSFAGFLPADKPQFVTVIVLEEPEKGKHWGGVSAAPTFRNVMNQILNINDNIFVHKPKGLTPVNENQFLFSSTQEKPKEKIEKSLALMTSSSFPISPSPNKIAIIPEVRGKNLRSAISTLQEAGLRPMANGSGTVYSQFPSPGKEVKTNSICKILLR